MVVWNTRRRKDKVLHQKVLAECDRYGNKEATLRDDTLPSAQSVQGNEISRQSSRTFVCLSAVVCVRKVSTYPYAWAGWGV